jgi:hypothetical protein
MAMIRLALVCALALVSPVGATGGEHVLGPLIPDKTGEPVVLDMTPPSSPTPEEQVCIDAALLAGLDPVTECNL